jgi:hypothetical protein
VNEQELLMATSQELTGAGKAILSPAAFASFEAWSEWVRNNMGATAWIPSANDPLMLAMENLRNTVPPSNLIPINWKEIAQALQTLWMRKMSNPVRAMQAATEHNRRLFETTMDVWNDAAARFWGFPLRAGMGCQSLLSNAQADVSACLGLSA